MITSLCLGAVCLAVGLSYAVWNRDACSSFFRLEARIAYLEGSRPPRYSVSDNLVGLFHHTNPLRHYTREAAARRKALLAAGRLVELRVPYTAEGAHSDRNLALALARVYHETRADYCIDFDLTNRLMLIACRPRDATAFMAAVK